MSKTKVISVRVEQEVHAELLAKASAAKCNVSDIGRELIQRALRSEAPTDGSVSQGSDLRPELKGIRAQISFAIELILVATKTLTPDEAKRLVQDRFP